MSKFLIEYGGFITSKKGLTITAYFFNTLPNEINIKTL